MIQDEETVGGFKRITPANLDQPDISRAFGVGNAEHWIALFGQYHVSADVPELVAKLFELARGAMIYGWFYYPLLATGYAECSRTLEAGARHAGAISGLAGPVEGQKIHYADLIDLLTEKDLISREECERWHLARKLRNSLSHPTTPTFSPLDMHPLSCVRPLRTSIACSLAWTHRGDRCHVNNSGGRQKQILRGAHGP